MEEEPKGSFQGISALLASFFLLIPANAAVTATLTPSLPSPQPVATLVNFAASASGEGELRYRFRVRPVDGEFRTVRDFSPVAELEWTAAEWEGAYEIEVAARDSTGATATAIASYGFAARPTGVSETANSLVRLYSAPPCPSGRTMQVQFWGPDGRSFTTPGKPCREGLTMNFYIAGLRPATAYKLRPIIWGDPGPEFGPETSFLSGDAPADLPASEVTMLPLTDTAEPIVLHGPIFPKPPWATDRDGTPVWYYAGAVNFLTRPAAGGRFWAILNPPAGKEMQVAREFDLVGMTVREINAARINEQLRERGKREIGGFHHEALTLKDGKVLLLAGVEQIMTDVQGPGDINVMGDMLLVLDENLQVLWTWDSFDHLDPTRVALLSEACSLGGCSPTYLAPDANDWVHGNSVTPTHDGNLLYSARNQDWVIKIRYDNGAGDGAVLWKIGRDGDFQLDSGDPILDWFSHQHDAQMLADGRTLILFDNANVRHESDPDNTRSRGQVYEIDEVGRTARLILNADLGAYSFALGSAQKLRNGTFHFNNGWLEPANTSVATEVDAAGNIIYSLTTSTYVYRSFRLVDLYTAPD